MVKRFPDFTTQMRFEGFLRLVPSRLSLSRLITQYIILFQQPQNSLHHMLQRRSLVHFEIRFECAYDRVPPNHFDNSFSQILLLLHSKTMNEDKQRGLFQEVLQETFVLLKDCMHHTDAQHEKV